MLDTAEVKEIYKEIQKKIYYMIPEKWDKLYLYASITEKAFQMPIGELYFYYYPKSILKKNAVNVYEIPLKFNIDEKQYVNLVKNLYGSIKRLWEEYKKNNKKLWTNITISIEDFKFKIEFNYETLENNEYNNYDRHIIWRYKYLGLDIKSLNRKERKIIEKYISNNNTNEKHLIETYEEPVYKKPVHNILDYNKSKNDEKIELNVMEEFETNVKHISNQILSGFDIPNKGGENKL